MIREHERQRLSVYLGSAAGPAQVLNSELMGHFRPVFAGFNPLAAFLVSVMKLESC